MILLLPIAFPGHVVFLLALLICACDISLVLDLARRRESVQRRFALLAVVLRFRY